MKSMTGYGHSVYRSEDYSIECEIKGYNSRYLDIVHNISPALSPFEKQIDDEVKRVAARGRVELTMKLKVLKSHAVLSVDEGLVTAYKEAYERISKLALAEKPQLSDYTSIDGVITVDVSGSCDTYDEGVHNVLSEALKSFAETKANDGRGTLQDLERLGNRFDSSLQEIKGNADRLESHFRTLIEDKYKELTGQAADNSAFMTELGAILVRYSINEEVSRLGVHIAEYRRLLSLDEPVGKKLDFLCQEMQRECNTIASKSQLVDINLLVVSMKDDIENIREQIRNIE